MSAVCHPEALVTNENSALESRPKFIALVGCPNSGKTTLYNWMTGSRFKAVNYPGSTIEYALGKTQSKYGASFLAMDTPGTYSLFPKSPEEHVTVSTLFDHPELPAVDVVVSVVDATQLSRHLFLTRQLVDSGFRVVVALTNVDLIHQKNLRIDVSALEAALNVPFVLINGQTGFGTDALIKEIEILSVQNGTRPRSRIPEWSTHEKDRIAKEFKSIAAGAVKPALGSSKNIYDAKLISEKIDHWLLHPFWGIIIFAAIMTGIFSSIFWLAAPLMDFVDEAFGNFAGFIAGLGPGTLWADFLSNGVVASIGAVVIFVPQIAILFLGLCFLEDSGYLARAASLIDKPLSKIGLNGRSFIPILSGYACAIPGMMAARTISNPKERWITLWILPLMSCSARLPVYALLLAFIFRGRSAWLPGLALAGLYFGSLLVGAIAATIANRFLKIKDKSFFILELPIYRRPKLRTVIKQVALKTTSYLVKAGPIIFALSVLIWLGATFPKYDLPEEERLGQSYAALLGQGMEPVMEPLGVDWRVGVGLISAFAAREVFVSSLAVIFNVTDEDEDSVRNSLLVKMESAVNASGEPIFTTATVIGLILFFMIALQCMATFGVARREFGNWRSAILQLVVFNAVAYFVAVSVVQGLRVFGIQ